MRYFATLLMGISVACGGAAPQGDAQFGLSLADRQAIFVEMMALDETARGAGDQLGRITETERAQFVQEQIDLVREVIADEHDVTVDQLDLLVQEALEAGWPRR